MDGVWICRMIFVTFNNFVTEGAELPHQPTHKKLHDLYCLNTWIVFEIISPKISIIVYM